MWPGCFKEESGTYSLVNFLLLIWEGSFQVLPIDSLLFPSIPVAPAQTTDRANWMTVPHSLYKLCASLLLPCYFHIAQAPGKPPRFQGSVLVPPPMWSFISSFFKHPWQGMLSPPFTQHFSLIYSFTSCCYSYLRLTVILIRKQRMPWRIFRRSIAA